MAEQNLSFEEMAIQEKQGLRPSENVENRQFTMAETEVENARLNKAQEYVDQGKAAKEAKDDQKLKELNKEIEADPEMVLLMQEKGESVPTPATFEEEKTTTQPSEGESGEMVVEKNKDDAPGNEDPASSKKEEDFNLAPTLNALNDFQDKFNRIIMLGKEAHSRNASTESIFKADEFDSVGPKLKKLNEVVTSAKNPGEAEAGISEFNSWFDKAKGVIDQRIRAYVDYFGGTLPDGMQAQARLFQQSISDFDNMVSYIKLAKSKS